MAKQVTIEFEMAQRPTGPTEWPPGSAHYRVTLRFDGRQITTWYSMGPACCSDPEALEVLSCLISDMYVGEMTWSEFRDEFGIPAEPWDEEGRTAHRRGVATWRTCQAIAVRLRRFVGDDLHYLEGLVVGI